MNAELKEQLSKDYTFFDHPNERLVILWREDYVNYDGEAMAKLEFHQINCKTKSGFNNTSPMPVLSLTVPASCKWKQYDEFSLNLEKKKAVYLGTRIDWE